jgi:hypothetical protein
LAHILAHILVMVSKGENFISHPLGFGARNISFWLSNASKAPVVIHPAKCFLLLLA